MWDGMCVEGEECEFCPGPPPLVATATAKVEQILILIQTSASAQLAEVVKGYRDRLLVSPSRNLVVVQGSDCNPQALEGVVFVSAEKSKALQLLGLRLLDDFLKSSAPQEG